MKSERVLGSGELLFNKGKQTEDQHIIRSYSIGTQARAIRFKTRDKADTSTGDPIGFSQDF